MLASSSVSSAAEEGVLRTLVGDSTSLSSGILRRADLAVMAGTPPDGRAGAVSPPVKPLPNPPSALFLSAGGSRASGGRGGGGAPHCRHPPHTPFAPSRARRA